MKMDFDIENTFLFQYRSEIKNGKIIVGQELLTELDTLLSELETGEYYYDTKEANLRIAIIENFCKHSKDPFTGKPFILMLWQKAFLEVLYSYKIVKTKRDRFKRAILLIARKNGKSTFCAALAFCDFLLGGGKDIVCSSNDDRQASIIYEEINQMRLMFEGKKEKTKKARTKINQKYIINKKNNNKICKISERVKSKDGGNYLLAILDESWQLVTEEIPSAIIKSQSLKINPKFINISTEGYVEGYLTKELKKCRSILSGERDDKSSKNILIWLYTQDSEKEIWQADPNQFPNAWQKSNPSLYYVKSMEYLEEQLDDAKIDKVARIETLCKDFNIHQNSSQSWLNEEDFNYIQEEWELEKFRNSICIGAVDLSETTDLSNAKILLMKKNSNKKYIHSHYFIPESKLSNSNDKLAGAKYEDWRDKGILSIHDGNENDLSKIADWFYMLYKKYNIKLLICGYDQKFSKEFLRAMEEYDFDCEMILQNAITLSNSIKLLEAELKAKNIEFQNNECDKWCYKNAALKMYDQSQVLIVKKNNDPSRRIDGAVTAAILFETFRRHKTEFLELRRD